MLGDAVGFPKRGDSWLKTVLIGGLLSVLSVLILPAFVLQGFFLRVLAAGARGDREPPTFSDWGDLLVTGVLLLVIALGYFLVPTLLLVGVALAVGIGSLATGMGPGMAAPPNPSVITGLGVLALVGTGVAVLLYLLAAYLLPAGATNYAVTGELGAAFRLRTVLAAAFTADYTVAWILAIVVSLVFGFVGGLLSVLLVGIVIVFYGQMVTYYLLGRGTARSGALGTLVAE